MSNYDIVIIGGGLTGITAALAARKQGAKQILLLEAKEELGGKTRLLFCTGVSESEEDITGPEFIQKGVDELRTLGIEYRVNSTVISISKDKIIKVICSENGVENIKAKSIIIAVGAKERPRGTMNILGRKLSGVYTAGTVQRLSNLRGALPGKEVVILGSKKLGLIMARRLTIEGVKVKAIVEQRDYIGGTRKLFNECVEEFGIPLLLNHTVKEIKGKDKVEGVTIVKVDNDLREIRGTEKVISCDTILLSVGLESNSEILEGLEVEIDPYTTSSVVDNMYQTQCEGVFNCGNSLHVHDYVNTSIREAEIAGYYAAKYIEDNIKGAEEIRIDISKNIKCVIPKSIKKSTLDDKLETYDGLYLKFRADEAFKRAKVKIYDGDREIYCASKDEILISELNSINIPRTIIEKVFENKSDSIKLEISGV